MVTSLPNLVSAREKHRLRRDQGDAGLQRGGAQALLQHGLGFGELRLGVDPAHVVLPGFDRDRLQAHVAGDGNRIGEIEFALGIVIADAIEDGERACLPASAISPPLQKSIARSASLASRSSRIARSSPPRVSSRP